MGRQINKLVVPIFKLCTQPLFISQVWRAVRRASSSECGGINCDGDGGKGANKGFSATTKISVGFLHLVNVSISRDGSVPCKFSDSALCFL